MPVTHDDMSHPVPPIAYLRYKENWFFLIMDREHEVFGAIHVVGEPGFDRIRFAVNLRVAGELITYGNQIDFPRDFGTSPEQTDGLRSLRNIQVTGIGEGPGGVPATVEFQLTDIHDTPFTIVADLTGRHAYVPLHTEAAGAAPFIYDIVENLAPLELKETGETGIGIVEVGWSTPC